MWCNVCHQIFFADHWHCTRCGAISGQFGHTRKTGGFSCEKDLEKQKIKEKESESDETKGGE